MYLDVQPGLKEITCRHGEYARHIYRMFVKAIVAIGALTAGRLYGEGNADILDTCTSLRAIIRSIGDRVKHINMMFVEAVWR